MFLFGILQGNAKTNWIWIVIVGVVYFCIYYFLFSFLIVRMDLKTPGRDDSAELKLYRRSDLEARKATQNGASGGAETETEQSEADMISAEICRGLGGKRNISDVDCCATRLRCTVYSSELVSDAVLKATGASGVVHKGNGVQIIYGPRVTVIKSNLEDYLEKAPENAGKADGAQALAVSEEVSASGQNGSAVERAEVPVSGQSGAKENDTESKQTADSSQSPNRSVEICSPVDGVAASPEETPDEAFAGKMMGDGAMAIPYSPLICAPADGEVAFVFDTGHALGFTSESGLSLLIHVGIDTVKLEGRGFEVLVENGQKLKKGEPMLRLDLEYLRANAPSLATPVLCTELEDGQRVRLLKRGEIKTGEALFALDSFE